MNQHLAVKSAKVDIRRALAILELCPDLEADEQLKLSTLEGETELNEIVSLLLSLNEDDEGMIEQIKGQIAVRKERIARFGHRIETRKNAIVSLLDCAMITKLPLPEATVSVRTLQPRPKIVDEAALPNAFVIEEIVRKPDLDAIEEAVSHGATIPGVILTNGGASLTVRRK
jgi:hypothetical protein